MSYILDTIVDGLVVISIAPPGSGCLEFGGATGGIRARGSEALGSEGSGSGVG